MKREGSNNQGKREVCWEMGCGSKSLLVMNLLIRTVYICEWCCLCTI